MDDMTLKTEAGTTCPMPLSDAQEHDRAKERFNKGYKLVWGFLILGYVVFAYIVVMTMIILSKGAVNNYIAACV